MDENIRQELANQILGELENLGTMTKGSEEHKTSVDNVCKLYKLALEDVKTDNDYDEKWNRRDMDQKQSELDEAYRDKQLSDQRRIEYGKMAIQAAGIMLPLMLYAACFRKGLKFEETGTFTSATFKGLFNKIGPKK